MVKSFKKSNTGESLSKICIGVSFLVQCIFSLISLTQAYATNFVLFVNLYFLFFAIIVFVLAKGINKHFLLFAFLLCFFVCLMGQKFFVVLRGGEYTSFLTFSALTLDGKEYLTFVNLLYFSLFGCFVGYSCRKRKNKRKKAVTVTKSEKNNMRSMRKILRALYAFTFICTFIMQFVIMKTKRDMSYTDGYLINVDVNPILKIGNYLFIGIAFLYLACAPSKKEVWCILITFLSVQGVLQLFMGRRALLTQSLVFVLWFCVCYFKLDKKKFTWKHFACLLLFAIAVITLFSVVEVIRGGQKLNFGLLGSIMERFFISTGGSDSTVANIIYYQDKFPKSGLVYLIEPIQSALFDNVIIRNIIAAFTGYDTGSVAQGLEYLARHDSFSHWLSYTVNPDLYVRGYGMGSSYVAEIYFAFGFVGIVLFGIALGILIKKCTECDINGCNVYAKAFQMFIIYNLSMLPRGSVFASAGECLYLAAAMLIVKLLYSLLYGGSRSYVYGVKNERIP